MNTQSEVSKIFEDDKVEKKRREECIRNKEQREQLISLSIVKGEQRHGKMVMCRHCPQKCLRFSDMLLLISKEALHFEKIYF